MNHLGIDPGTVNIGTAITDDDGKLLYSRVFGIEECGGIVEVVEAIQLACLDRCGVETCAIERYVPYRGQFTKVTEDIVMLIGALLHGLTESRIKVQLTRAIEWKQSLCKYLFKTQGFKNPSASFDKKYSIAVAEAITGQKMKNNHIADAVGLSHIWKINNDTNKNKT